MVLNKEEVLRYSRHLLLPEVGAKGQEKLKASRILLIGSGGLGSPNALYLAATGIGTIGIVDFDVVDHTNLQRQLLFGSDEVGNPTYAADLAAAIAELVRTESYGVYHLTNAGYTSRYDYVREVLRLAGRDHISVEPMSLDDYPRLSTPPRFAPLANVAAAALGIEPRSWQEAVREFLES